jgi:serine/threonine-protein kinase
MTLGTHRLERLLGSGGMGAVFLAYDTRLHRQIALKVINNDVDNATSSARLLREARAAAALNHPNICTIHEVGDAYGAAFIAMEYVAGRSLRERIDEGALSVDEAARLGSQAAEALAYAHDHGVIHRDFKAANAIVAEDGRLKVVDFGLARRDDGRLAEATTMASLALAGRLAGTPYSMAPEQVRTEGADARTDIWALGVLLYEMVTGTKPFVGRSLPELFSSILTKTPAPLPSTVPATLCAVIERCLEKDPADRYQHAGETRAALDAITEGTVAPWATWRHHLRRRPILVPGVILAFVVAALVGFNVAGVRDRVVNVPQAQSPIRLAVLPFKNLTGDPEQEYFTDGLTDEMITQLGALAPQRLNVIARTSVTRYKNRETPIDQIGRELGVAYVLEASARREGRRVRISTALIQVRDQTQRWSQTFERDLASILALQSDVARGVAGSLALTLLPEQQMRLASAPAIDPDAYQQYLRGREQLSQLTPAGLNMAQRYFELAIEKHPDYALALAGLSAVWSLRLQFAFGPAGEAAAKSRAAAERSVALDPTLAEAHYRLAVLRSREQDWAGAEREFKTAIDLNPNYPDARSTYSHFLFSHKRPTEALTQIRRALELDPLSPLVHGFYARGLIFLRRYDEALAESEEILKTVPTHTMALGVRMEALYVKGRYDAALQTQRLIVAARDPELAATLDRGATEGGYVSAMRRAADLLAERSSSRETAWSLALFYMRAEQPEQALKWLERAVDRNDPNLMYLGVAPTFDPLRRDPRFQALLRRLKLPT